MVVVGMPGAVMAVMGYGQYGGAGWMLYLICIAFAGAYVWGLLMWHLSHLHVPSAPGAVRDVPAEEQGQQDAFVRIDARGRSRCGCAVFREVLDYDPGSRCSGSSCTLTI
jgi:hypothetical protein